MANQFLDLPQVDYGVTFSDIVVLVTPYDPFQVTGVAVVDKPQTAVAINIQLAVDGVSLSRSPLIEVVTEMELGLTGDCEVDSPTTENTPMSMGLGLKGIV